MCPSSPSQSSTIPPRWWESLYDEHLASILLERRDEAAHRAELDFIEAQLQLEAGHRVFDQCCGIGSLALPLAQRGYDLHGIDLIEGYIRRARAEAEAADLSIDYLCGDAMKEGPGRVCDAAYNWWTSFGYAPDDGTNLGMLRRAHEALRPGGRFLLDTMNAPGVRRHFLPVVHSERETPAGRLQLTRFSALEDGGRSLHKRWCYRLPDGSEREHRSRVRLYDPDELAALFETAGFELLCFYGDVDASSMTSESRRCIILAQRPEGH